MNVSVVIPSNRPDQIARFFAAWEQELENCEVIVVEDGQRKTFDLPAGTLHYSWAEIDESLGEDAWIIPRKTDCVRSFGFLMSSGDVIVTLDDDCEPWESGVIDYHKSNLCGEETTDAWADTVRGLRTRGVPKLGRARVRPCAISHGLWTGVPDVDAETQIKLGSNPGYMMIDQTIPHGKFFAMCGMNLAFRRELLPAMYFLLMGEGQEYDRFGDIWCGLFAKAVCDHLGFSVHSGRPYVKHERASNPKVNLEKEKPGYEVNEWLWKIVDRIRFGDSATVEDCYLQIAETLPRGGYFERLRKAMRRWVQLCSCAPRESCLTSTRRA